MTISVQYKNEKLQGNEWEAFLSVCWSEQRDGQQTNVFELFGLMSMSISIDVKYNGYDDEDSYLKTSIALSKINEYDPVTYTINVNGLGKNSDELFILAEKPLPYKVIGCERIYYGKEKFEAHIKLTINILSMSNIEKYFSDTELTDFKLIGEDGFIEVHRLFLADCCTMMKTLLTGEWKETKEGQVKIPATFKTLTHFKEYIYLDKLPDSFDDLEVLLELGACYQISDLVQKCLVKLVLNFKPEDFFNYVELARKYESNLLLKGIHQSMNFDSLFSKVDDASNTALKETK